jgi:HAD superfamily hydrolase (TIGR01509 family)
MDKSMYERDRRAVFFDLDGTLLDSTYLHALAWWQAFDEAGERQTFARIHHLIGMGGSELMTALIGRSDDVIEKGHSEHMEPLRPLITPLPGAKELVRQVKAVGGLVVIVTSATPSEVPGLLAKLDAGPAIDLIVDAGADVPAKPNPDLFARALSEVNLPPTAVLALGDSVWDVEAAGRTGVGCIGVSTGGIDEASLQGAGAEAVYASCAALLADWTRSPLGELFA